MTNERQDISKRIRNFGFIGAIMVVMIHIPKCAQGGGMEIVYKLLRDGFLGSAVPMFFIVSGYLLSRHLKDSGWWLTAIRKRITSLVVPYLVLNSLLFAISFVCTLMHKGELQSFRLYLNALGFIPGALGGNPIDGPLWYVRCLFLFVLTLPLFVPIIRRGKFAAFAFSLVLWIVAHVLAWCEFDIGWFFSSVYRLSGLAMFILGVSFGLYGAPLFNHLAFVALLPIGWILSQFCVVGDVQVIELSYFADFCFQPITLIGLWSLLRLIPELPSVLTSNSFAIYSMHWFFANISWIFFERAGCFQLVYGHIWGYLGFLIIVPMVIVLGVEVLRRYAPKVCLLITGGR